jgi:hypothetical protein
MVTWNCVITVTNLTLMKLRRIVYIYIYIYIYTSYIYNRQPTAMLFSCSITGHSEFHICSGSIVIIGSCSSNLLQITSELNFLGPCGYIVSPIKICPVNRLKHSGKKQSYPCNRPWSPIGLWEVEVPTFYRQSAHRWRWVFQPYTPATLYPPPQRNILGTHFC